MTILTPSQHREAVKNYYNNDIFDHVLLDEREPCGRIVTVVEYDEETIMVQTINEKGFNYYKYPKEVFLNGSR